MSIVKILSLNLALFTFFTACKTTSENQFSSDETLPTSNKQVLIVLGGFGSCGSDNVHNSNPLATSGAMGSMNKVREKALAAFEGKPDRVLSTCYTIEIGKGMLLGDIDAVNVFMLDSENPKVIERLPPEEMMNKIITTLSLPELKNADVHVVGHSYGGWTAMKLLSQIVSKFPSAKEQTFQLKSFVTLDPISKTECKPRIMIDHLTGLLEKSKVLPENITPAGCLRAPIEFNAELKAMACRVAVWKNYYQTTSGILSSSPIGTGLSLPITNIDLMTIPTERNMKAFTKVTVGGHSAFLSEDPLLDQVKGLIAEQKAKPFAVPAGCTI